MDVNKAWSDINMSKNRFKIIVDVHLLLIKDNKILLLLRQNTGYEDGKYHLPAGHMDGNEPLTIALKRESKEEVGISIPLENIRLAHVMHSMTNNERMAFFFEVKEWKGEVQNIEPQKHAEVKWFELNHLPDNMVTYAQHAIECYRQNELMSEYGWD